MSNNITKVNFFLNNREQYLYSNPDPRSDTYGRDGWYYSNYKDTGTIADQQCNICFYNVDDTRATNIEDKNNFLFLSDINSLYFEFTSMNTNQTNLSTETVMDYYPYIVIGTIPNGSASDLPTLPNGETYRSLIYLKISPTDPADITDDDELTYLYKNGRNVIFYREKAHDKNDTYQVPFKNVFFERGTGNRDNINSEQIKKIWIETKGFPVSTTTDFILHEAGIKSQNFPNNFNRIFTFSNIITNSLTNNEELVLHNGALTGLTPFQIQPYGYKNVLILIEITATSGQPQKNAFLSYSTDNISYYTDSDNITCQEFGSAGIYTGIRRIENVCCQHIKVYADDPQITNVKVAFSMSN
ncbi:hypothetical protein CPAV1605_1472 [seawater metagenome]|uniref:Uncharacterized protein n=1 Tax=seawater metagenome TaxID=1561972 RepID=A0A5E8CKT6_9ZZZZ